MMVRNLRQQLEALAAKWSQDSIDMLDHHNETERTEQNEGFRRSCWQRYVDFERRANELRTVLRYWPEEPKPVLMQVMPDGTTTIIPEPPTEVPTLDEGDILQLADLAYIALNAGTSLPEALPVREKWLDMIRAVVSSLGHHTLVKEPAESGS